MCWHQGAAEGQAKSAKYKILLFFKILRVALETKCCFMFQQRQLPAIDSLLLIHKPVQSSTLTDS